jgi:hypothetical protein
MGQKFEDIAGVKCIDVRKIFIKDFADEQEPLKGGIFSQK